MKKLLIFILSLIGIVTGFSQSGMSLSGGLKFVSVENRTIDFWYIDESPSRDNISKQFEISGSKSIDLGLRYKFDNNFNAYSWNIGGQFYIGALIGLALEGGIILTGKNNDKNFKFQPELNVVVGNSWIGIGPIENNDIYIQVNETKFRDYTNVNVRLETLYMGLKPGINISYKLSNERYLGIRGSYQISVKKPSIGFNGKDDYDEAASATESLKENNVGFYIDGVSSNKMPFNPDGIEVKVFYGF
jgi:hypothetical protein